MDTKQFLESILCSEGHYCVWANNLKQKRHVQKFYPTLDAVVVAANNFAAEGFDAYFALASFVEPTSREAINAKALKSFFVDIDCGPEKDYADKEEGIKALKQFCKDVKLPRPTVVDSGRGIHAYWPLEKEVSASEWKPIAEQFKSACKHFAFNVDMAVPADTARVLRIPETFNFKNDPPTPVQLLGAAPSIPLEVFKELLDAAGLKPTPIRAAVPRALDAVTDALTQSGNIVSFFEIIMNKTTEDKGCKQLHKIQTEQTTISEPLWRAGLSIAQHCADRDEWIHKISSEHPQYSASETEDKASRTVGPYTCEKFNEFSPGICAECSHFGKIKSPIVLGRKVLEATEEDNIIEDVPDIGIHVAPQTYVVPNYPFPFFRGKNGGIFKRKKDADEDAETLVYKNDFYVLRRILDPDLGESVVMRLHLPKDGVREFTIPLSVITSKDEFRRAVCFHGVTAIKVEELMHFTTEMINNLQSTGAADPAVRQFGWTSDRCESFALGNKEIMVDRINHNAPSKLTAAYFPLFNPKGTFEQWTEVIDFFNRPGMEIHQYALCAGFGSVLAKFGAIPASLLHIYSKESGRGKTTGLRLALSVWGDWKQLMMTKEDTHNSKMLRTEVMNNLPVCFDELTNITGENASKLAYEFAEGRRKNGLDSSGMKERIRGVSWATLGLSSGNTSLLERMVLYKAAPKGEAARVLEYEQKWMDLKKEDTDAMTLKLENNYGHAGIPFVQFIMSRIPEVKEKIATTQRMIDKEAGLRPEHRLWSAHVTYTLVAATYAKQLGLIKYNLPNLAKWAVDELLISGKTTLDEMDTNAIEILSLFLAENYSNWLRIRSSEDARTGTGTLDHLVVPDASPRVSLAIRYEYDVKRMYILPKPLREWCSKYQHSYKGLFEGLKSGSTKAVIKKIRMGKGTNANLPPMDAIMINAEFLDEGVEQALAAMNITDALKDDS